LWVTGPVTAGPAVGRLLEGRADSPALAVEAGAWLVWFVGLVAVLVPSPRSLTVYRTLAPAALGMAVVTMIVDGWNDMTVGALGWAAVTSSVALMPTVGDLMVNGSAYGSERRMTLRPPAVALLGPIQVAWLVVFASLMGLGWAVAAQQPIAAVAVVVIGGAASWAAIRILHQLSQRWIVFVPAGFVLKDPMLLIDAVLCRRNKVESLGPALSSDGVKIDEAEGQIDLSGAARGLALEVRLKEPTPLSVRLGREAAHREASRLVFTPSLPGAMLREARIRGIKIAAPTTEKTLA
jgi:hypothetical protein